MARTNDLSRVLRSGQQYASLDLLREIVIQTPGEGSAVCPPSNVLVTWFPAVATGTFKATLDNVDVTGQFQVDEHSMTASATLSQSLAQGSHVLAASADWPSVRNTGTFVHRSAVCNFSVPPLPAPQLNATLIPSAGTLGTAALDIVRGMQNVVAVDLVTDGRCHPDMEIRAWVAAAGANPVAGPYLTGVTFNTPFTIPAGSNRGLLYITSAKATPVGTYRGMVASSLPGSGTVQLQWFDLSVRPPV